MIDQVLKDLEKIKSNITEKLKLWFRFSVDMATAVSVSPSVPRIAKCWSRFSNNVPSEDNESYYQWTIAIPVMNALTSNLNDRMADGNHTELFTLLPAVCLSSQSNFENSVACLLQLTYLIVKHLSFYGARWNVGLATTKGSRKRRRRVKKPQRKKRELMGVLHLSWMNEQTVS